MIFEVHLKTQLNVAVGEVGCVNGLFSVASAVGESPDWVLDNIPDKVVEDDTIWVMIAMS